MERLQPVAKPLRLLREDGRVAGRQPARPLDQGSDCPPLIGGWCAPTTTQRRCQGDCMEVDEWSG
jgi:hypothetical protein